MHTKNSLYTGVLWQMSANDSERWCGSKNNQERSLRRTPPSWPHRPRIWSLIKVWANVRCFCARHEGIWVTAGIVSRILNPHTKRTCIVSCTYRPLCCQWNSRVCPLHRSLGGPRNGVDPIETKNTCCSCREWDQLFHCPVRNATTIVTTPRFFNHLKSRDCRINTSCKVTTFCMFHVQVNVFCIPIITKHRSFSYTLTGCFLNEDGKCSVWDKKLTLI